MVNQYSQCNAMLLALSNTNFSKHKIYYHTLSLCMEFIQLKPILFNHPFTKSSCMQSNSMVPPPPPPPPQLILPLKMHPWLAIMEAWILYLHTISYTSPPHLQYLTLAHCTPHPSPLLIQLLLFHQVGLLAVCFHWVFPTTDQPAPLQPYMTHC